MEPFEYLDDDRPSQAEVHRSHRLTMLAAWGLALLFLGLAAAGTLSSLQGLRAQHAANLANSLGTVLEFTQKSLQGFLMARTEVLTSYAQRRRTQELVQAFLAGRRGKDPSLVKAAEKDMAELVRPLLSQHGATGLALVDADFINLFSIEQGRVGEVHPLADRRDYLQKVFAGQTLVIPPLAVPSFRPGEPYLARLFLAAPVPGEGGRVAAALVLALDPAEEFSQLVQSGRLGETGDCYLFDGAGRFASEPVQIKRLRGKGLLSPGQSAILSLEVRQPGSEAMTDGKSPTSPLTFMAARALSGSQGRNLEGYANTMGHQAVGVWTWLPDLGLGLAVEMDAEEAYRPFLHSRLLLLGGLAAFAATMVFLLILLGRQGGRLAGLAGRLENSNQELTRERDQCRLAQAKGRSSEARFSMMLDNLRDLIFAFPLEPDQRPGPMSLVNQAVGRLLGYGESELLGGDPLRVIQPLEDHRQHFRLLEEKGELLFETLLAAKDGRLVPAEINAHLFELEGRRTVLWVARDISQRRRTEQDLREREARLEAIVDGFEGFIYICSQDFRIEFVNDNLRRHLGRDPVGEVCYRVLQGDNEPCPWCADGRVRRGATMRRTYFHPLDQRWYHAVTAPLVHPDGRVSQHGMVRDVTDRKLAELELRDKESFLLAVLSSLPAHIAVLDSTGQITAVNGAWEEFGHRGGADPERVGKSANYLEVLEQAVRQASPLADQALAGLKGVLEGERDYFQMEYGCQVPGGALLWFQMVVTPLEGDHRGAVVAHHDITERKRAQERLAVSEANYRAIFNTAEDAIFVHDAVNGLILDANVAAERLYGYSIEQMRDMRVTDLSAKEQNYTQAEALDHLRAALDGQPQRFEWRAKDRTGRLFWVEVRINRVVLEGRERLMAMVSDQTSRKQGEEKLRLAAKVFENSIEGITITDPQGAIQMVNPGFTAITGYQPEEVLGQNPRILRSDRHDPEFYKEMWEAMGLRGQWSGEIWNRRKNGEAYPEWLTISAIKDDQGQTSHYVAVFHDITEIKRSEERIRHQAYHDALTGLPNRALFNDRLRMALARAKRNRDSLAVVFMDLDHFKNVNDSLGHAVGDLLLQEAATRLKTCLRQEDTVSRLGGDEFIMIMPDLERPEEAVAVATRILEGMKLPFNLRGHEIYVTASLGITIFPSDGENLETLVKNADMAMYRAKDQGRNTYQLYTPSMNKRVILRQNLLADLRKALERDELVVYYQPKVDLADGQVTGMEALVRWQRPDGKVESPGKFIPLAEETGLILPMGQRVLEMACRDLAEWQGQGHQGLSVAVNLSARQLVQPNLVEIVETVLADCGLSHDHLELEITESTMMSNLQAADQVLKQLHGLGVSLALDDFGTGYSSLYYLKHLAIDVLKIDRTFVRDVPGNPEAAAIVEAVISLARSLGLKVVAEGVETRDQLGFLRTLGCHYMQGYLFGRPMPKEEFGNLLVNSRRMSL